MSIDLAVMSQDMNTKQAYRSNPLEIKIAVKKSFDITILQFNSSPLPSATTNVS